MKSRQFLFAAALLATLTLSTRSWAEGDEEADLDKLPAAVQKTAHEQLGKAAVEEVEPAYEAGQHATEVEYTEKGQKMAVVIAADGKLIQKEHRLSPGDAPDTIKKAVDKLFPGARISHIKQVDRDGNSLFEVAVKSAGKSRHVRFDLKGTPLP